MYGLSFRTIALEEYFEAIEWYNEKSLSAAANFIEAVDEKLDSIEMNPFQYKRMFKHYHEVSTHIYPYSIVYFIEESVQKVVIVAIYHHKRNPKKKYRK
jgi:plasmid stabilization system protein ParE